MIVNDKHLAEITSTKQTIKGRVELYSGSTLIKECTCSDILSDFIIERSGSSGFFGFGICQKATINLIDLKRELNITNDISVKIAFGVDDDFLYPLPIFYVDSVERDETSNLLTITAYDALYNAASITVSDLALPEAYTIGEFIEACASALGVTLSAQGLDDSLSTLYASGANFDGTETVRAALSAAAQAVQAIYYIDSSSALVFKRLDKDGAPVFNIDKNSYIELKNDGAKVLKNITHTTELGDAITTTGTVEGITQYIRNNPFWELREDLQTLLDNAQAIVGGLSINQFDCYWIGNYLLEIGDKISLTTEDDGSIISYLLEDTINYAGTLDARSGWQYAEDSAETAENPTSLGDALNKTFARVDKINQEIQLKVSQEDMQAYIEIATDGISSRMSNIEKSVETKVDINGFNVTVSNTLRDNEIDGIQIKSKSFSFNENGLTITAPDDKEAQMQTLIDEGGLYVSKDGEMLLSATGNGIVANNLTIKNDNFTLTEQELTYNAPDGEIETKISGQGFAISKNNDEVLTADNTGVKAVNLHATTYLIIGDTSRFENYTDENGTPITACFWIGR